MADMFSWCRGVLIWAVLMTLHGCGRDWIPGPFTGEDEEEAQYRLALPHYYLAQIYEQLARTTEAYQQWEDCLRLLERGWAHQEWRATVLERMDRLEEEEAQ